MKTVTLNVTFFGMFLNLSEAKSMIDTYMESYKSEYLVNTPRIQRVLSIKDNYECSSSKYKIGVDFKFQVPIKYEESLHRTSPTNLAGECLNDFISDFAFNNDGWTLAEKHKKELFNQQLD